MQIFVVLFCTILSKTVLGHDGRDKLHVGGKVECAVG